MAKQEENGALVVPTDGVPSVSSSQSTTPNKMAKEETTSARLPPSHASSLAKLIESYPLKHPSPASLSNRSSFNHRDSKRSEVARILRQALAIVDEADYDDAAWADDENVAVQVLSPTPLRSQHKENALSLLETVFECCSSSPSLVMIQSLLPYLARARDLAVSCQLSRSLRPSVQAMVQQQIHELLATGTRDLDDSMERNQLSTLVGQSPTLQLYALQHLRPADAEQLRNWLFLPKNTNGSVSVQVGVLSRHDACYLDYQRRFHLPGGDRRDDVAHLVVTVSCPALSETARIPALLEFYPDQVKSTLQGVDHQLYSCQLPRDFFHVNIHSKDNKFFLFRAVFLGPQVRETLHQATLGLSQDLAMVDMIAIDTTRYPAHMLAGTTAAQATIMAVAEAEPHSPQQAQYQKHLLQCVNMFNDYRLGAPLPDCSVICSDDKR